MSIASEVSSMEDNIRADYEGLANLGADLTGINKNILNIRTILDTIYNDMPKVTDTGTEVTLSPTRKGRLALIPKGNSTQYSTTGKQLFNINFTPNSKLVASGVSKTTIDKGVRISYSGSATTGNKFVGYVVKDLSSDSGKTLRIKASWSVTGSSVAGITLGLCDSSAENRSLLASVSTSGETTSVTIPTFTDTSTYLYIYLYINRSSSATLQPNDTADFIDPIITIDNSDMSYEQYTGNLPSPNPSYPQTIKSVTGNNNVVVNSKNLINQVETNKSVSQTGIITNPNTQYLGIDTWVSCSPNTTYAVSFEHNNSLGNLYIGYRDKNDNFISRIGYQTARTFTTPNNAYSMFFYLNRSGVTWETVGGWVQLEYGSTATFYVPYQNQTKPLNLGTKKVMLDDYLADNGIHHKRKQIKITNSTVITMTGTQPIDTNLKCFILTENFNDRKPATPVLMSHFKYAGNTSGNNIQNTTEPCFLSSTSTSYKNIYIITNQPTIEDFRTWAINNNLIIEYELEEETIEAYTETQQAQYDEIQKMQGYNGTTIITSTYDSNNAQMYIQASALKGE